MVTNILWFRRDLRLVDQEIVTKATVDAQPVLPCFIIDPWFYTWSDVCKARVRFLFESLEDLDCNLRQRGSKLYLFEGNAVTVIQELTQQLLQLGERPKLFFNHDVQVQYGIDRDPASAGCASLSHHHQLLPITQPRLPPGAE